MYKFYFLFIMLLSYQFAGYSRSASDSLTYKLKETLQNSEIKGFGVAIVRPGGTYYARGFGYANAEKSIPYNLSTVQPVASIAKTLLGISIMKAQEMGKLDLDDPVNDYLPFKLVNPHHPDDEITIRHLASHTSGLTDPDNSAKAVIIRQDFEKLSEEVKTFLSTNHCGTCRDNQPLPMITFLKNFYEPEGAWYAKENFLDAAPGTVFHYSNYATALAAYVLETATGQNYKEFTRQHIFEPLDMKHSGWDFKEYSPFSKSVLYGQDMPLPAYEDITYPDGSFVTNLVDFSKYLRVMMKGYKGEGRLLKAESFREMMSSQFYEELGYGIFWELKPGKVGHGGSHIGVTTYMYFDTETDTGYVVFFNTSDTENLTTNLIKVLVTLKEYSPKVESGNY